MTKARNIADLGSNDVIETSATGVDVTGTVTADGLTVENTSVIAGSFDGGSAATYVRWSDATDNWFIGTNNGLGGMLFKNETADANRFFIGANGDVSFFEDTGSTAKMTWDSSAERLFVGTSTDKTEIYDSLIRIKKDNANKVLIGNYSSAFGSGDGFVTYMYNTDPIVWTHGSTERMRIDSSGNVGIGTDTVTSLGTGITVLEIKGNSSSQSDRSGAVNLTRYDDTLAMSMYHADGASILRSFSTYPMIFNTNGSERARIDSSGNLLVGKTAIDIATSGTALRGTISSIFTVDGTLDDQVAIFNRTSSDGDILRFDKDGSTVGAIGTAGSRPFFASTSRGLIFVGSGAVPCTTVGTYEDNIQDLGRADGRFDDVYATNGTINTSDRNEKQDIEVLNEAEKRVAQACKGLLRKFRWKDSVAEKGDDARIHFGIIAQDLRDAFEAEGLDAGDYAMFISTTWYEKEITVDAVEAQEEVLDEDGNVVTEAVEAKDAYTYVDTKDEATDGYTERTRLGVRYPELLAFIIAAI